MTRRSRRLIDSETRAIRYYCQERRANTTRTTMRGSPIPRGPNTRQVKSSQIRHVSKAVVSSSCPRISFQRQSVSQSVSQLASDKRPRMLVNLLPDSTRCFANQSSTNRPRLPWPTERHGQGRWQDYLIVVFDLGGGTVPLMAVYSSGNPGRCLCLKSKLATLYQR